MEVTEALDITAAVARRGEPFRLERCQLGQPQSGEVGVRILACGICPTDLAARIVKPVLIMSEP